MSVVHVKDLAYIRLQSPDLDRAEEFLTHLGMARSERTSGRLYMRGTDPSHHIHITHHGPPKYLGLAFWVDGQDDLRSLAQVDGASGIEQIDEPGGGWRVRFTIRTATRWRPSMTSQTFRRCQSGEMCSIGAMKRFGAPVN